MMELSANEAQLQVGLNLTTQLRNTIDNTETDFLTGIENVINQAIALKFDLDGTIDIGNVTYEFENTRLLIDDMDNLANADYELVKKYETGHVSEWQFQQCVKNNAGLINPDKCGQAVVNLVAWESVVGMMEVFEGVTDFVWYYSASNAALNGDSQHAREYTSYAQNSWSSDLIRNSDRYRRITRGTNVDRDSTIASASRIAGAFALSRAIPEVSAEEAAAQNLTITEHVVANAKPILYGATTGITGNTVSSVEKGEDFTTALGTATIRSGAEQALSVAKDYDEAAEIAEWGLSTVNDTQTFQDTIDHDQIINEASELDGPSNEKPTTGGAK